MLERIGIMQGRLTNFKLSTLNAYPNLPFTEIEIAKKLKLSHIEFFTQERLDLKNLIWSGKKLTKLSLKLKKNKLRKISFIDNRSIKKSFVNDLNYYYSLINQISKANFQLFILPLIGKSEINSKNFRKYTIYLNILSKYCSKKKINFAIETDISFNFYRKIRKMIPKNFGIVFDTGNRYLKRKKFLPEILKFQKEIKHVHLKDRNKKGENVSLGKGLVNFKKFFENLKLIKYKGYFTLETTREKNAIKSIISNLEYLKKCIKKIK